MAKNEDDSENVDAGKASRKKAPAKKKTPAKKKVSKKKAPSAGRVDRSGKDKARKEEAIADYSKLFADVEAVKSMTDTKAWQDLFSWIKSRIGQHSKDIMIAEKSREFIQHQEAVKAYVAAIDEVKKPINRLNDFIRNMPLFAVDFHTRAEWNEGTGRVELRTS